MEGIAAAATPERGHSGAIRGNLAGDIEIDLTTDLTI
jgi:hypothetical protein